MLNKKLYCSALCLLLSASSYAKVELYPNCADHHWEEHSGSHKLFSRPEIFIHNDKHYTITEDFTMQMCVIETGQCTEAFWHRQNVPQNNTYRDIHEFYMNVSLHERGDYHFIVQIQADGEWKEHYEKVCTIHVTKK